MFRFVLGMILGAGAIYVINEHPDLAAQAASSLKAQFDEQLEHWLRSEPVRSEPGADSFAGRVELGEAIERHKEQLAQVGWYQLWQQLHSSEYARRAAAAAIILERCGIPAASGSIRLLRQRYLRSADPQVRRAGFSYLGVLALLEVEPDQIESLCRSYVEQHPADEATEAALWALGQLGRTSLAQYFISVAADPGRYGPQARRRALCCLANCGRYNREQRRSFLPMLQELYRNSSDEQTRAWAAKAIRDCSA